MYSRNLLKMAVLATAFLLPVLSWSQVRTYFEDDFAAGPSAQWWNLEGSTQIEAAGGPYYLVAMSSTSYMAGWAYDPDAELISRSGQAVATTPLDGVYALLTLPYTLEAGAVENVFSLDYLYAATGTSTDRNFGLMARAAGGEWDTVYRLYDNGATLADEDEGTWEVVLPESYAGQEVELAVFCDNASEVPFVFMFNNVEFAAWTSAASLIASVDPVLVTEADLGVELRLRTASRETVSSAQMSWQIEGSSTVNTFDLSRSLSAGRETTQALDLPATDLTLGSVHTLLAWNNSANGETVASPDTMRWRFTYVAEADAPAFVPSVEVFTSATCGPCATMNRIMNPVLEQLKEAGNLNIIKYQVNIPSADRYYIPDNGRRQSLYGVNSAPSPFYNGTVDMGDWYSGSWSPAATELRDRALADCATGSLVRVEYTRVELDSTEGMLSFDLGLVALADMEASVFTSVIEGTTTGNRGSNGEREFHWVTMAMPGGAYGKEVSLKAGETITFTYEVDMSETNVEEYSDLEIVCLVQNPDDLSVYQSAGFDIYADEPGNLPQGSEAADMLPQVRLYPNPARETAFLTGLNRAEVQVFDLAGRLVYEAGYVDNQLEIPVASFRAGTYMLHVSQDGVSCVRKLTVLK